MDNYDFGHVTSVEQFYQEIRQRQVEEFGGIEYVRHHDVMQRLFLDEGCSSYRELGTHQGASAAAVMLTKPKIMELIDTNMDRFNRFLRPLAEAYCAVHNIELSVRQISSTSKEAASGSVDVLLVDTWHNVRQVQAELEVHSDQVGRFIVFHDTATFPKIKACVDRFCFKNRSWKVIEHCKKSVGTTVIKRERD